MKEKISKNLIICLVILVAIQIFAIAMPVFAGPNLGINFIDDELNLATADPRVAAVNLIGLLMTFLGIIAVVMILYGGFVWLTAGGNDDRAGEAKKIIGNGILGLIIILAAFLIVNFVVEEVSNALNG